MDNDQKKNVILIAAAVLLLIGALVFGFRDSLFGGSGPATASVDNQTAAAIGSVMPEKDRMPEPDSPNPPPRGSGKKSSGGN